MGDRLNEGRRVADRIRLRLVAEWKGPGEGRRCSQNERGYNAVYDYRLSTLYTKRSNVYQYNL